MTMCCREPPSAPRFNSPTQPVPRRIEGSEVPADIRAPVERRFDKPQPDWKPVVPLPASVKAAKVTRTEDALRLILTEANRGVFPSGRRLRGGIYVDLPAGRA